jgi:hypothetical protein
MAAITLEGVLRSDVGGAPIPEGFNLYQALVTMYRVAVVLDDTDDASAALWLRKEGLRDYVLLHPRRPLDDRVMQYRRLQALGTVSLVIDSYPTAITGAFELGIPSLLFADPRSQRPEWRPDYERTPRPWDALVARVEQQRVVEPDV